MVAIAIIAVIAIIAPNAKLNLFIVADRLPTLREATFRHPLVYPVL